MDAVEEIKGRLSIEDVISEYVQLKRSGRNWKGLSPFSNEKTPSFMVSPEKQIWHDFSSGKGGDMFSFVMAMEGLDFKGALELLARKAGVDLEQYRSSNKGSAAGKEKLYEILELSTKFYQSQLSSNQAAVEYVFKKRQFSKDTALAWRLGYAPNTGSALVNFLKKRGYSDSDMKRAGLTSRFGSDMFRGRLMIPLADAQGRIVGFTARLLADEPDSPKYINTPATPLYDKSRHVYGLHLAKEAIRQAKFVVLAEGNLDVIMSWQAGVRQVVATAGTALTEYHLKALSRLTGDIRLCFDADQAGMNATERAIPIASKVKVELSIVTIPTGKDPDELIKQDVAAWQKVIQAPQPALDWLMDRYQNLLDLNTSLGKRDYSDVLLPVVRRLSDPVEQEHYLGLIASKLQTEKEALRFKMSQIAEASKRPLKRPKVNLTNQPAKSLEQTKHADYFLAIMLKQPKLRHYMDVVVADMFSKLTARALFGFLRENQDFKATPAELKNLFSLDKTLPEGEQSLKVYVNILDVQFDELYGDLDLNELRYEAIRTRKTLAKNYVDNQKAVLSSQLNDADERRRSFLLEQAKKLDELLNDTDIKGGR